MSKEKKTPVIQVDVGMQIRMRPHQVEAMKTISRQRGMKQMDVLGKLMRWFLELEPDEQAYILGQITHEGLMAILDKMIDQLGQGESSRLLPHVLIAASADRAARRRPAQKSK